MSRKKSPEARKRREMLDGLIESRVVQRGVTEDVPLTDVGVRRLQVLRAPAFCTGYTWDIREQSYRWRLFRAEIPHDLHRACGYTELVAESDELKSWFDRVCEVRIPVRPILNGLGGADGTGFQLAVFGDLHSAFRFTWWSDAPKQWKPLTSIAEDMMAFFETLSEFQ